MRLRNTQADLGAILMHRMHGDLQHQPRFDLKDFGHARILWVLFDTSFGYQSQVAGVLQQAGVRHGVMARLARST